MSDQETVQQTPAFDWVLWLKWTLLSTLGWVVGWALTGEMVIAVGAVVGMMQWIVLRPLVHQAGWWIVASGVGWAAGYAVTTIAFSAESIVLPGAVIGAALGTMQWLVLQRLVYRAVWWIVISSLSWAIGPILGAPLVGAVVGAVTGLGLELLLRHPRPKVQQAA
jgi:hypothetical protein